MIAKFEVPMVGGWFDFLAFDDNNKTYQIISGVFLGFMKEVNPNLNKCIKED